MHTEHHHHHRPTQQGYFHLNCCVATAILSYVSFGALTMLIFLLTLFKSQTDRSLYEFSYSNALSRLPATNLQRRRVGGGGSDDVSRPAVGSSDDLTSQKQQSLWKEPPASWSEKPLESTLSSSFFVSPKVRCVDFPRNSRFLYIAANLYQSEEVLPVWLREMKRFLLMLTGCEKTEKELEEEEVRGVFDGNNAAAGHNNNKNKKRKLRVRRSRVFVSVFTNKCSDRTNEILRRNFLPWLLKHRIPFDLNVEGLVNGEYSSRPEGMQRIEWLSRVRNEALKPLVQEGTRVFLNPEFVEMEDDDANNKKKKSSVVTADAATPAFGGDHPQHEHVAAFIQSRLLQEKKAVLLDDRKHQHPREFTEDDVVAGQQTAEILGRVLLETEKWSEARRVDGGKNDKKQEQQHAKKEQEDDLEDEQNDDILLNAAAAEAEGDHHRYHHHHRPEQPPLDQIDPRRLSALLPPLTDTRVLFLNDIVFTAEDLLLLLFTRNGNFDMACGMDYYFNFYDTWVARDVGGRPFWAAPPYSPEAALARGVEKLSPVNVGCCWNGAVVAKARVFVREAMPDNNKNEQMMFSQQQAHDFAIRRFWTLFQQQVAGGERGALVVAGHHGGEHDVDEREKDEQRNAVDERKGAEHDDGDDDAHSPSSALQTLDAATISHLRTRHPLLTAVVSRLIDTYLVSVERNIFFRWSCPNECCLSECSLLCRDMRRPEYGAFKNIVMNPLVRVAYDTDGYLAHRGNSLVVDYFHSTAWVWASFNKDFFFPQDLGFSNASEGLSWLKQHQKQVHAEVVDGTKDGQQQQQQQQSEQDHSLVVSVPLKDDKTILSGKRVEVSVFGSVPAPEDDMFESCFSSGAASRTVARTVAVESGFIAAFGLLFTIMTFLMLVRFWRHRSLPIFLTWRFWQVMRCRTVARMGGGGAGGVVGCEPQQNAASAWMSSIGQRMWCVMNWCCVCGPPPTSSPSSSSCAFGGEQQMVAPSRRRGEQDEAETLKTV